MGTSCCRLVQPPHMHVLMCRQTRQAMCRACVLAAATLGRGHVAAKDRRPFVAALLLWGYRTATASSGLTLLLPTLWRTPPPTHPPAHPPHVAMVRTLAMRPYGSAGSGASSTLRSFTSAGRARASTSCVDDEHVRGRRPPGPSCGSYAHDHVHDRMTAPHPLPAALPVGLARVC